MNTSFSYLGFLEQKVHFFKNESYSVLALVKARFV